MAPVSIQAVSCGSDLLGIALHTSLPFLTNTTSFELLIHRFQPALYLIQRTHFVESGWLPLRPLNSSENTNCQPSSSVLPVIPITESDMTVSRTKTEIKRFFINFHMPCKCVPVSIFRAYRSVFCRKDTKFLRNQQFFGIKAAINLSTKKKIVSLQHIVINKNNYEQGFSVSYHADL